MKNYKFTFTYTSICEQSKVTYETNAVTISDVINDFTDFLKGCGYIIPEGHEFDLVSEPCIERIEE